MIVTEYWRRIGLESPALITQDGLAAIQRAHRLAIAFENLDICLGREIRVDPEQVFGKLVTDSRGGYCFEQNVLLAAVLTAMGVPNRPVLARVWLGASETPPLTHLALLAEVDGESWLMDAGFGGGYCPPMRLNDGETEVLPDSSVHRLSRDKMFGWMLEQKLGGVFVRQYSFTLAEAFPADIQMSNHWTSTHPTSRFKQNLIVNRVTEDGRVSLMNGLFTRSGQNEQSFSVTSPGQLEEVLEREFGLHFSDMEISVLARQIQI